MADRRVDLLDQLRRALEARGCAVEVFESTLCVERRGWDEHSGQDLLMASGIGAVERRGHKYYAVVQEHRDGSGSLQKYSITLLDKAKSQLRAWHLDTKRGQHAHIFVEGKKTGKHVRHEGSVEDIADEIVQLMV